MSSKCYRSFEHYIKMNQLFLLTFLIHFLERQVKSINHSQSFLLKHFYLKIPLENITYLVKKTIGL